MLRPQLPVDGSVEIICKEELPVVHGGPTIGANRNAAVADAIGEYVCFIDDDDMVRADYVERILKAINPNRSALEYDSFYIMDKEYGYQLITIGDMDSWDFSPDVVGFKGHYIVGEARPQLFVHSMQYKEWTTVGAVHQRCPNHLNPVKRELALQVPYPEKNHGEDQDYSMALLPLLKTEVMIDDCIMYFYLKN